MKEIRAIVRLEKLDDVKNALIKNGCPGMTVIEVSGHGKQQGIEQTWRGEKFRVDLLPKVLFDIVVADKDVPRIIQLIVEAAKTGSVGDGKIFVRSVEQVVRIRTGESGDSAV